MRQQKENAKVICEQNKKINEKAFVPIKESKDKKEVPRMKVCAFLCVSVCAGVQNIKSVVFCLIYLTVSQVSDGQMKLLIGSLVS